MVKKIKSFITTLAVSALALIPAMAVVAPAAHAQVNPDLCKGINFTSGEDSTDCGGEDAEGSVRTVIQTVIDVFSIVVGAVSVIMIIIGGLRYITSSGDSGNVQAAKNTILYAIVGLVIVIFAQTIVKFVVNRISSAGE